MKRFYVWIIIFLLILVSIGNDRSIEISDRTLVHAVGIDENEDGCTVTMQIFKSDGAGSDTQIDPSKSNTRIISNTAKTFNEAMSLCENQLGNYLFIGHNQVIVIGSGTDLSKPDELLSYFIRNKDNFLGVDVVLAENTAKELLNIQIPTGTITMENFKEIVDMYQDKGEAIPSSMVDFIRQYKSPAKSAALPVVSIKKPEEDSSSGEQSEQSQSGEQQGGQSQSQQSGEQQQSGGSEQGQGGGQGSEQGGSSDQESRISIEKNAVISKGKIVGFLNPQETQCVNLINDRADYAMITIDYDDTRQGINLKKRNSKSKIKIKDDQLVYDVDLSLEATVDNTKYNESDKQKIAGIIESEIANQCQETFNKVFKEYDADILDFYRLIKHYHPKLYLRYQDNFDALKDNTSFNINVKCITK